jgi:hypothetical protein
MMSSPIIDSLALWGIEGMSQAQTLALIQAAPDLLATLLHISEQLADHPACMDADATDEELDAIGGDSAFLTYLLRAANQTLQQVAAA